jgi:hypothetical protein
MNSCDFAVGRVPDFGRLLCALPSRCCSYSVDPNQLSLSLSLSCSVLRQRVWMILRQLHVRELSSGVPAMLRNRWWFVTGIMRLWIAFMRPQH